MVQCSSSNDYWLTGPRYANAVLDDVALDVVVPRELCRFTLRLMAVVSSDFASELTLELCLQAAISDLPIHVERLGNIRGGQTKQQFALLWYSAAAGSERAPSCTTHVLGWGDLAGELK
jgi:hypothetical protein